MARGRGGTTQYPDERAIIGNGANVPPSTLAAQIVRSLSSKDGDPKITNQKNFEQLLSELLGAGDHQSAENRAFEKDLNVNYKIVKVIIDIGLKALLSQDPFAKTDVLLAHASDSLSVIHLTLQRIPRLVFFSPTSNVSGTEKCQPRLFLILLPTILSLVGHPAAKNIQEKLAAIMALLFEATGRLSSSWTQSSELLNYFRLCVVAILQHLESANGGGSKEYNAFEVILPPEEAIKIELQSSIQPESTRTSITDPLQGILIALDLLAVLLSRIWDSKLKGSSICLAKSDYAWVMDSFFRLWTYLGRVGRRFTFSDRLSDTCSSILSLFRDHMRRGESVQSKAEDDKAWIFLIRICADLLRWPRDDLTTVLENELRLSLVEILILSGKSSTILEMVEAYLYPVMLDLNSDGTVGSLSQNMQDILSRFIIRRNSTLSFLELKGEYRTENGSDTVQNKRSSHDNALADSLREMDLTGNLDANNGTARPPKRRRTSGNLEVKGELITQLTTEVFSLLGSQIAADLDGLHGVAGDCFVKLPSNDQCRAFKLLGDLACAGAGTLDCRYSKEYGVKKFECSICDKGPRNETQKEAVWDEVESQEVFMTFQVLIKISEREKLTKPRICAMLALRKLMAHTTSRVWLDLGEAHFGFGRWCLGALSSSLRELRIAAGRALPIFLKTSIDTEVLQKNRIAVLDFLRIVSDKNQLPLLETCVLAWAQVAYVLMDDGLNIVLLRLVQYLGHTNPFIYALAYDQLQRLAQELNVPFRRLLMPFLPSIAVTVVKDLQSRPQTVQLLSDLLNMDVPEFLLTTQSFTLPYLVLLRKQDIIVRIAQAREKGTTIAQMCLEAKNLAPILAFLLVQQSSDLERRTMALLREVSPGFDDIELAELACTVPIPTAAELLKMAGDQVDAKKAKVHQAMHLLASLVNRKSTGKKANAVGVFFETFVLAVMALFAASINDLEIRVALLEKRRCLRGIDEMIKLAKGYISDGLPQICACLQSALEVNGLRDQAFSTWVTMMQNLTEDDTLSLLGNTFSIVVQYWEAFAPTTQQQAVDMIGYLLKTYRSLIKVVISTIPSLKSIPLLSKYETDLAKLRSEVDIRHQYEGFSIRCRHENITVVEQALSELVPFLWEHQDVLHVSAVSEQPDPIIGKLTRAILDACVRFNESRTEITRLCAQSLGLIGCVDPNRVEAVREKRDILVLDNFERADESIEFVVFFLQEILVKAFLSATDTKAQGFLAFSIQELLKFCAFDNTVTVRSRVDSHSNANVRRWLTFPESIRNTLTPFLTSRYHVTINAAKPVFTYPLFPSERSHSTWVRNFTLDLLGKAVGENAVTIFSICSRVIRAQDISIANFLLPFIALNIIVGGEAQQRNDIGREQGKDIGQDQWKNIGQELLAVLAHQLQDDTHDQRESLKLSSETVFQVLDYLARWMQEKKKQIAAHGRASAGSMNDACFDGNSDVQVRRVQQVLSMIPADVISSRAVECKSYARALFHWEMYIRQQRASNTAMEESHFEPLFERLQDIYTQIDEPDGIEGISAQLQVLNIDQQILEHRKAGRWTAAQSWYELLLAEKPDDTEIQINLLTCLKESGQHEVLLNHIEGLSQAEMGVGSKLLPFAVEASWVTGKWDKLNRYLGDATETYSGDFNVSIGHALLALYKSDSEKFSKIVSHLRENVGRSLSGPTAVSLQACHDHMLKLHVLTDIELISGSLKQESTDRNMLFQLLDRRLEVVGAFLSDKQYLLGLRRAAMQLSSLHISKEDIASAWLTSARLARKAGFTHQSFNAVLHASQLGAQSATIEHSRLLWAEGHHRKAIQSLQGAIAANIFSGHNDSSSVHDSTTSAVIQQKGQQNILIARANLLLAKWLDTAGQSQSENIIKRYQEASNFHLRWEKGHYYLGRHYNKIFESERALPPNKRSQAFVKGETASLVINNYLRSLGYGAKYIFQTLPRVLTLWQDLGAEIERPIDAQAGSPEFRNRMFDQRKGMLEAIHKSLVNYITKLPAFVFYTAFPQIVARISHSNRDVYSLIQSIIVKVVTAHPQQALWALFAVVKSGGTRGARGRECLSKIKDNTKRMRPEISGSELRAMILQGQKLSEQLLHVCDKEINGKPTSVSLTKELGFNHKTAPCPLVVPIESTLTASLPTISDIMKRHKAFAGDAVTISSFFDDVLILNSLQRPRKISARGSDGRVYGLLCKPKDDLRKDQRLMTFNSMINKALKKDADSSLRRLYIKTYAVTPLNEECGIIEWVDNLKPLRDILLNLYRSRGINPNYNELRLLMDEACSHPSKLSIFTDKVLASFPPVFHEWFIEMFPGPGAWFAARLKYTRSCAVMSMVGMVLGLGDRHGENILFEEGNGGTFHVDFNCLFDKGMTFEKPEKVPFRLTHNMVDAFGVYGYEGPFRKSCELTMKILRQNEDTLMTILEAFLHDPTTDFIGVPKKKNNSDVPDTPQGVLDSVQSKVRGLLKGESVPLSVEGHVQELIQQAVSPANLVSMYIGCHEDLFRRKESHKLMY